MDFVVRFSIIEGFKVQDFDLGEDGGYIYIYILSVRKPIRKYIGDKVQAPTEPSVHKILLSGRREVIQAAAEPYCTIFS